MSCSPYIAAAVERCKLPIAINYVPARCNRGGTNDTPFWRLAVPGTMERALLTHREACAAYLALCESLLPPPTADSPSAARPERLAGSSAAAVTASIIPPGV